MRRRRREAHWKNPRRLNNPRVARLVGASMCSVPDWQAALGFPSCRRRQVDTIPEMLRLRVPTLAPSVSLALLYQVRSRRTTHQARDETAMCRTECRSVPGAVCVFDRRRSDSVSKRRCDSRFPWTMICSLRPEVSNLELQRSCKLQRWLEAAQSSVRLTKSGDADEVSFCRTSSAEPKEIWSWP